MCGIFCLIAPSKKNLELLQQEFRLFEDSITRRGPNYSNTHFITLDKYNILFAASVLWLQGDKLIEQPLESEGGEFIYNGDIFGGLAVEDNWIANVSDTLQFWKLLGKSNCIWQSLQDLEGPFAFIYFDKLHDKIYFARDKYGRRSLLIGKKENEIILTSVAKRHMAYEFIELPCIGIFCFDLNSKAWHIFPWRRKNTNFISKLKEIELFLQQNVLIDETSFEEIKEYSPPADAQLQTIKKIMNLPPNTLLPHLVDLYSETIAQLKYFLENSIKKRILTQPKFCQNCFEQLDCDHAITGILFSGGVDCAILAFLAHNYIKLSRPIDLINVAFETNGSFNTPDRETGKCTLEELQLLAPERKWNFVEVNVTRKELDTLRNEKIADLIYPLTSVLDDSLGCALWFASRASTEEYTSPCRTLLVGMGADELFGGYTRHRAAFKDANWQSLHVVLEEDWQNLPHRNLARDDRVVSDHGRQLRTPYLDEEFVNYVQSLNCWEKTIPSKDLPDGIGGKILLRSLAYSLGLRQAATFKKRALQFGSRIANSKEKGHETSERLLKTQKNC